MNSLIPQILDISRQNKNKPLSPSLMSTLEDAIASGFFPSTHKLETEIYPNIIQYLIDYREQANVSTAVVGMSGGVDSALTAALFKNAGWRVIGVTMPIHQDPEETIRGQEAINSIGIEGVHIDLSALYESMLTQLIQIDPEITGDTKEEKIRRGNLRARARMITLYNLASKEKGLVASTDNLSELAAGFWTLHGDVGDVSPIQALNKSWEVPYLAKFVGVPESTWRATPTDGLGIDSGDEAQFGCTYLEFDIMLFRFFMFIDTYYEHISKDLARSVIVNFDDQDDERLFEIVWNRIGSSWYKRTNPVNVEHNINYNLSLMYGVDSYLFHPKVVKQ